MTSFKLPFFSLHESLKLNLPQSVVDCCSLYSIIHNINKSKNDALRHIVSSIEAIEDEESPLVHAVSDSVASLKEKEVQQVKVSVLDEEKFLLLLIESRKENEDTASPSRSSPSSYLSAGVRADSGKMQAEDFQYVLPPMKNELWKPARSWWEAKSSKNPWLEPKDHNKRWWYLKPLIQYHKFLLKCVKKLKRSNINAQTSSSPVCAFLREEISIVSGHLRELSFFTSERWMEGLPHFSGWIGQNNENEMLALKLIVSGLPTKYTYFANNDSNVSLPQKEIDEYFFEAIANIKNQVACDKGDEKKLKGQGKRSYRYSSQENKNPNQFFSDTMYIMNPYQTYSIPSWSLAYHQDFYHQPYNCVFYQNC